MKGNYYFGEYSEKHEFRFKEEKKVIKEENKNSDNKLEIIFI